MHTGKWSSVQIYGIESAPPEVGSKIEIQSFGGMKRGITSGYATVGSLIGVNGGMNPTAVIPGGDPCNEEFWTSKQAYYHSYVWDDTYQDWKDRVVDSSIMLLHMTPTGQVKESIDLEPVIRSIVSNLLVRADVNERVAVASYWVNTDWYQQNTTARNYSGVLGPVYAGINAVSDVTTKEPWMSMRGPSDPANIGVRDIILDSKGNLWCLLQLGWEFLPVYGQRLEYSSHMAYECRLAFKYDDSYIYGSTSIPTNYPIYDPNYFPRQYVPPHSGTSAEQVDRMYRCGLPRARMMLVCFNKATNFKTWDYLPFIPGTVGFKGKYYVESPIRGPCAWTITNPPLKLDIDEFGNVYAVTGGFVGVDARKNKGSTWWWEGKSYGTPEYLYFYCRYDSEMVSGYVPVTEGLDVGRIGPYTSGSGSCSISKLNFTLECTAYQRKYNNTDPWNPVNWCFKSPWTYTIGGDRAILTASFEDPAAKTKYYWLSALGNRTLSKCSIKIDTTLSRPIPVENAAKSNPQRPWNIRSWRSEWYELGITDPDREMRMEFDLLFAQCDLFTRNYYGASVNSQPLLASMRAFDPASWWINEEKWKNLSYNNPSQVHLDRTGFFQTGNSPGDLYTGFNVAEAPLMFYPHMFSVGNSYYEMQSVGRSGEGSVYTNRIPLYSGSDGSTAGWDQIIKPASTPYIPTAAGTDYFEKCAISGCFPTMKTRGANEDTVIVPFYNFKYEMFTFSGLTWDSFAALRGRYPQTRSAPWPFRWHSMKHWVDTASTGGLYAPRYGAKSSYIDPTVASPGDYTPAPGEKVVRYTAGFVDAVAVVTAAATGGDTAAQQALTQFNQYLASVKFSIYETVMQNLNFGSFGSSIKCSDKVGMLTPMPLLHATYTHENGNWNLDLIWDPDWGKRLYVITAETKNFDCTWAQQTSTLKRWWAKIVDWASQYVQVYPPVNAVKWYDFSNDQVQILKEWVMDPDYGEYCVERWQQLEFVNGYPDGKRVSPQLNTTGGVL